MLHRALPSLGSLLLVLVFVTGSASAQNTLRAAGAPVLLLGDGATAFAHPTWSPDGSQLALTRPGYDGLWVTPPDGSTLRQLTDEPGSGFGFVWSPDGSALLSRVSRSDGPTPRSAVKVFDVETGASEAVTDYRTRMRVLPRWSADGSAILLPLPDGVEVFGSPTPSGPAARPLPPERPAFVSEGTTLSAVRLDVGGARTERLLDGQRVLNVTPSPDHARVAFEVMGGNLHVMNADGSGLIDLGPGHRPSWSPDGRWIAFMRTEDDGERITAADLVAVRSDGSTTVVLTQTPSRFEMNPSWSPDGRWIAFDDLSDGAIYLLPIAQ